MAEEQPPAAQNSASEPPADVTATPADASAAPAGAAPAPGEPPAAEAGAPEGLGDEFGAESLADAGIDQASIDEILKQASFEDVNQAMTPPPTAPAAAGSAPAASAAAKHVPLPPVDDFRLPNFQQVMQDAQVSSIDLLRDVDLNVKIELGRSRMLVEDVLKLSEGSVVELDKLAGDPVDVFVNERLVARGEVLVLNDNFCVRINEIVAGTREDF